MKYQKPKDSDWLRVTFDGKTYVTRDYDLAFKLAKRKNGYRKGDYYRSGDQIVFYKKEFLGKWKHERFSDKECTKRVKV